NPSYAGTYVFGRYQACKQIGPTGEIRTQSRLMPQDEWRVVIPGHHPGYITWDQFLATANAWRGTGPIAKSSRGQPEMVFVCCRACCSAAFAGAAWVCAIPAMAASTRSISATGGIGKPCHDRPA